MYFFRTYQCVFASLIVGHTPDYIADLLTPVADIPTRSSLRASSNGNLFLLRAERRFGDRAFSVAAPRVWNRLLTELKLMRSSTTTFKRHLKTFLFNSAHSSTDYRMRHRTNCRRRTTNAAVTVTVITVYFQIQFLAQFSVTTSFFTG